jgi:hypothetical protein
MSVRLSVLLNILCPNRISMNFGIGVYVESCRANLMLTNAHQIKSLFYTGNTCLLWNVIFWAATPCGLVLGYQRFSETSVGSNAYSSTWYHNDARHNPCQSVKTYVLAGSSTAQDARHSEQQTSLNKTHKHERVAINHNHPIYSCITWNLFCGLSYWGF